MKIDQLLSVLDKYRREQGFKEMDEMIALAEHNSIPDPFSVLISKTSKIGAGNTFYPCVTSEGCRGGNIDDRRRQQILFRRQHLGGNRAHYYRQFQ